MNQQLIKGRRDTKPEGKELDLISTERVSFSQLARFKAFKSENVEVENTDFLIVTSSSIFGIKKLYRKIPIMVFQKKNEERYALLQGQPNIEFMRTGDGAGYEGTFNYVVTTEGHVGYCIIYNPKVVSSSLTPATTEKSHFRWKIGTFINFKVIHLSTLKTVKNH